MKTSIYTYLLILAGLLGSFEVYAQNRQVYWVHGLKGQAEMFTTIANDFDSRRKMASVRPQYNTDNGIQGSANELQTRITTNNPQAILIAQSMGGLNVRQFYKDRLASTGVKPFGGLITTGTPHLGARVADNMYNGKVAAFVDKSVDQITKGARNDPVCVIIMKNIAPFLAAYVAISDMVGASNYHGFISNYPNSVLKLMTTSFFGTETTKADLTTYSEKISQLKSYNMNIPQIAIYGVEDYPATLRNAYSKMYNKKHNFNLPIGGYDDDDYPVEVLSDMKSTFYNISDVYYGLVFVNIASANIVLSIICGNASTAWSTSAAFCNGPFQRGLDDIMGAVKPETRSYTGYEYTCGNSGHIVKSGYLNSARFTDPVFDPNDPCWQEVTYYYEVLVPTESDGVVTQESAWSLPGARSVQAMHVNHEQLKNSKAMKIIFDNIYSGVTQPYPANNFFKIDNR